MATIEHNAQPTQRPRAQRTKLTLADIGNASRIKGATPDQIAAWNAENGFGDKINNKLILGRFVGIAEDFVERTSADKTQKFEGLKGQFRVVPSDAAAEELESGVCFFPDAFHTMIAAPLRKVRESDPHASARFGFQVAVIPAKNPAGYSWEFQPLIQADGINPLDELVSQVAKIMPPPERKAITKK